jgi:hypothetical protein
VLDEGVEWRLEVLYGGWSCQHRLEVPLLLEPRWSKYLNGSTSWSAIAMFFVATVYLITRVL